MPLGGTTSGIVGVAGCLRGCGHTEQIRVGDVVAVGRGAPSGIGDTLDQAGGVVREGQPSAVGMGQGGKAAVCVAGGDTVAADVLHEVELAIGGKTDERAVTLGQLV